MNKTQRIVAVFSVAAVCFVLSLLGLILVRNNTFKGRVHYHTTLNSAKGLSGYPSIIFKGYSIGRVSSFDLTDRLDIKVNFYVFEEYESLMYENTILEKSQNILSGEITDFKLILPAQNFRNTFKSQNAYVAERSSPEARRMILDGIVLLDSDGIEGAINKVNILLDTFIDQDISKSVNDMVVDSNKLVLELKKTVESYHASKSPKAKKALVRMVAQVNDSVITVNQNLEYLRGILKEIYTNKDIITPMLLKTSRAIDTAEDTLNGINNNPLIRSGIRKKDEKIRLETD